MKPHEYSYECVTAKKTIKAQDDALISEELRRLTYSTTAPPSVEKCYYVAQKNEPQFI